LSGRKRGCALCKNKRLVVHRPDPPLKLYWVTMKMEASYTLLIPAISQDEAIILADEKAIPMAELTDVLKDVAEVAEFR